MTDEAEIDLGDDASHDRALVDFEKRIDRALARGPAFAVRGRVMEVLGSLVKVAGITPRIGELCALRERDGSALGTAEVVGFSGAYTYLSALGSPRALSTSVEVAPLGRRQAVTVGDGLLGRVIDGFGQPIDGRGPIEAGHSRPVDDDPPDALRRGGVDQPFLTGVRAIDGLLTCGMGQRVGIFAPAGVGKSTLLLDIARHARADVKVIALVGERGRELGEFVRDGFSAEARACTVFVGATSDRSPMERIRAAQVATAIAEHFRDQGLQVLLLMDSLTRLARAQREVGLAVGEPPTRRGYPPSVFSMLPRLLERAGPGERGAITAFYTILTEGDDNDDPIAEEVRAILDGHFILSRSLASDGHFPAIDILASASRVVSRVLPPTWQDNVLAARQQLARHAELKLLLQIGEYHAGTDLDSDRALAFEAAAKPFLRQRPGEAVADLDQVHQRLAALLTEARARTAAKAPLAGAGTGTGAGAGAGAAGAAGAAAASAASRSQAGARGPGR